MYKITCNKYGTYRLGMDAFGVDTGVTSVPEMMDILGKETRGLAVEPVFNDRERVSQSVTDYVTHETIHSYNCFLVISTCTCFGRGLLSVLFRSLQKMLHHQSTDIHCEPYALTFSDVKSCTTVHWQHLEALMIRTIPYAIIQTSVVIWWYGMRSQSSELYWREHAYCSVLGGEITAVPRSFGQPL